MYRAGFIPSLDKEGWREAPGWFEAAIPQLRSDSYIAGKFRGEKFAGPKKRRGLRLAVGQGKRAAISRSWLGPFWRQSC